MIIAAPGMQGIVGIVGSLPLGDDRFVQFVKRFTRHRLFRGIRASGQQTLAAIAAGEAAGGQPDGEAPTAPDCYVPWLDCVWDAFGAERLMFGSNWPVSDKAGSYADVLGVVRPSRFAVTASGRAHPPVIVWA